MTGKFCIELFSSRRELLAVGMNANSLEILLSAGRELTGTERWFASAEW
jgi:hypothetical protein